MVPTMEASWNLICNLSRSRQPTQDVIGPTVEKMTIASIRRMLEQEKHQIRFVNAADVAIPSRFKQPDQGHAIGGDDPTELCARRSSGVPGHVDIP
jgi:hypothetical protein